MTASKVLKVVEESEIVYEGWEGMPTIELGTGTVVVSSLFYPREEKPAVAISFSVGGNGNIGEEAPQHELIEINKAGGFLQIIATSPEALDVLIKQAQEAKTYFNKENWPVNFEEEQTHVSK